jgi:hypothetical protein
MSKLDPDLKLMPKPDPENIISDLKHCQQPLETVQRNTFNQQET